MAFPDDPRAAAERALGYPYEIPHGSFAQLGERTLPLDEVDVDLSGRTRLLVYGSNASPPALARKLGTDPDPAVVLRATLRDHDVVYSAHVSAYGSVPATLRRSPGTEASVFVAHLTAAQLELIAATEPNYDLATLPPGCCGCEDAAPPAQPRAYLSRHGVLLSAAGSPLALAAIEASGRRLPAMDERQVLELVRDAVRPGLPLERFVAECPRGPLDPRLLADR